MSSSRSRWLVLFASSALLCLMAAPAEGIVSLDVQMTASPDPVHPGEALTYEITVTNTSADPNERADVLIQSFVPESTSLEPNSPSDGGTVEGNQVNWSIDNLPGAGGQRTVTLRLRVDFPAPGLDSIFNVVIATATDVTVEDIVVTMILPLALDLSVVSRANCAGSPLRDYTAEIVNGSTQSIIGVELTAEVPDSATLLPIPGGRGTASCSEDPNQSCEAKSDCTESCEIFWDIGTLASEETRKERFTLRVDGSWPDGEPLTTEAELTAGLDQVTASAITTTENIPCVTLEKIDRGSGNGPGSASPGGNITYSITAQNKGRGTATDVTLTDPLPEDTRRIDVDADLCVADESPADQDPNRVIWDLDMLDPNDKVTACLTLELDAVFEGSSLMNTATLSYQVEEETKEITDQVETNVQRVTAIRLRMKAEPSSVNVLEQLTFRIILENVADFDINDLFIADDPNDLLACATLDPNATAAANSDPNFCGAYPFDPNSVPPGWDIPVSVGPEDSVQACLVVNILDIEGCKGARLSNQAEATDARGERRSATAAVRIAKDPIALRLSLQRNPKKVEAGNNVKYTLELRNKLEEDLNNVMLTSAITPRRSVSFVSAESSQCGDPIVDPNGVFIWNCPTLEPGKESVQLTVTTSPTLAHGTEVVNMAKASADPNHRADDSIITKIFDKPLRLRMVDLIPNDPVKIGDEILYRISVDNQGNVPLGPDPPDPRKDIFIKTRVPHGTELVCVSGSTDFNCEQLAEGVRLAKPPSKGRKRVLWRLDERLGRAGGGENSRTMWMKVRVTKKRKVIRAKAIAKEFTFKTKRKARALTVVESD